MPCVPRFLLPGVLVVTLAAAFGCAGNETREYERELRPLVGRAPVAYFIDRYGEPEKRLAVDSRTEVLQFRVAEETIGVRGAHASLAVATELRLTFKDGILSGWKASNALR
jgi:hypothetical protein